MAAKKYPAVLWTPGTSEEFINTIETVMKTHVTPEVSKTLYRLLDVAMNSEQRKSSALLRLDVDETSDDRFKIEIKGLGVVDAKERNTLRAITDELALEHKKGKILELCCNDQQDSLQKHENALASLNMAMCELCGKLLTRDVAMCCSRCKTVAYCDSKCQKLHWGIHKSFCFAGKYKWGNEEKYT